ncbi:hypothetical protein SA22_2437 [Salmonella enterica subsp. enterica serovar Agona str. 22.H.04]|uniref:Uncharacterized protein n=2 Tax=Salmonella enterica I TaxID=59201 RepID=B5F980_SALA4|nr:hypothetical protein SeAg_B2064 [Salmonella enterica subsp. enterica serovar Agona str. SL483]ASL53739.1 hypothetical protein FORC52_1827 [Salmonella enterica subsp. enterica serovar Enteritidis]ATD44125.1 hypothetical protein FORC51_1908 [Salmonella enterica]AUC48844.1 Phage-like lysozyme [Salmonella enterica subsp. enterica serovar Typhimurium]EDX44113.1 hypothetical protein SeKA_A1540 [Salmonella enterica subsp. enterica serovar Kentucky str. CVM29188]EDZ18621.1 hypothetical protein SeKB
MRSRSLTANVTLFTWLHFSSSFRPQHAYQQVSLLSDCFA